MLFTTKTTDKEFITLLREKKEDIKNIYDVRVDMHLLWYECYNGDNSVELNDKINELENSDEMNDFNILKGLLDKYYDNLPEDLKEELSYLEYDFIEQIKG